MADYTALKNYSASLNCVYRENEPMSAHTSFQIGGPADLFFEPASPETLQGLISACKKWEIPYFIIGNGSNLLVSDSGIEGVVIHIGSGISDTKLVGALEIECGAGVKLSRLCSTALDNSLTGLEFAWGIPGTAGGAIYMNAGAYGSEMKNIVVSCTHITPDGVMETKTVDQLDFSYRHSVYSGTGDAVVSMRLKLEAGNPKDIRAAMDDLLSKRKEKQPLEFPSAGSTFKRPAGNFAGTLIEECGLKGYTVGGAQVSEKHAGFVVNVGGATCSDVRRLMEHVQSEVFLRTSIKLEPEVKIIGRL